MNWPGAWRPLKGWRVFAGEVGVVLLGVLLALGAQQLAEEIDRSQNRAFTEGAMRDEIMDAAINAYERLLITRCLRDRLAELSGRLAMGGRWYGDPMKLGPREFADTPALAAVYRTPSRVWTTNAWSAATANGILSHMDRDRVARLGGIYEQIGQLATLQDEETATTPQLTFLNRDQPLDQTTRVAAETTIARLDARNELIVLISSQLLDAIGAMHFAMPPGQLATAAKEVKAGQSAYRGPCVRNLRLNL